MFLLITQIALLLMMSSCEQVELANTMGTNQIGEMELSENLNANAQMIVLAAPSIHNDYYAEVFQDIVDFQVNYANKIDGRDRVRILVDADTREYYEGRVAAYVLLDANLEDIWIRDFAPAVASVQAGFQYAPDYLSTSDANAIQNAFQDWAYDFGLDLGAESDLILDGGNVVGNGDGKIVVTDRILYDNPSLSIATAKLALKNLTGASEVAIIRETPGDATGHADGMLMWVDTNTIILHDQPASVKSDILAELQTSFPGVEIVIAPDYYVDETWDVFSSACNIYVNSLVTNDYIYVPTFNHPKDAEMLEFIAQHTNREVVPVAAEGVCFMGGSVRCLSWQLDGEFGF